MKIISHRGNIDGKSQFENTKEQINNAIDLGFDVEIDLWVIQDKLYLGHDGPENECGLDFLYYNSGKLWIHAKNLDAVSYLNKHDTLNWFWHDKDVMTLTSKGYIWSNIGEYIKEGITVSLEFTEVPDYIMGVCSDEPIKYLKYYERKNRFI